MQGKCSPIFIVEVKIDRAFYRIILSKIRGKVCLIPSPFIFYLAEILLRILFTFIFWLIVVFRAIVKFFLI